MKKLVVRLGLVAFIVSLIVFPGAAIIAKGVDVVPPSAPPPMTLTVLTETFEDGVADGWEVQNGTWAVETDTQKDGTTGKVYSANSGTSNHTIFTTPFPRDLVLSMDVRLVQTMPWHDRKLGVILPDKSISWQFGYRGDTFELVIQKSVATFTGVTKSISSSESLKTTWDSLALEVSGSTLKGYRNGVLELQFSDAQLESAANLLVGLWSGGSHSHFDNVTVTTPGVPVPAVSRSGLYMMVILLILAALWGMSRLRRTVDSKYQP